MEEPGAGPSDVAPYGLKTFYLLRRGEVWVATGYVASSVVVGLLVLWLGFLAVSPRS